jgi:hypothetical protein
VTARGMQHGTATWSGRCALRGSTSGGERQVWSALSTTGLRQLLLPLPPTSSHLLPPPPTSSHLLRLVLRPLHARLLPFSAILSQAFTASQETQETLPDISQGSGPLHAAPRTWATTPELAASSWDNVSLIVAAVIVP